MLVIPFRCLTEMASLVVVCQSDSQALVIGGLRLVQTWCDENMRIDGML